MEMIISGKMYDAVGTLTLTEKGVTPPPPIEPPEEEPEEEPPPVVVDPPDDPAVDPTPVPPPPVVPGQTRFATTFDHGDTTPFRGSGSHEIETTDPAQGSQDIQVVDASDCPYDGDPALGLNRFNGKIVRINFKRYKDPVTGKLTPGSPDVNRSIEPPIMLHILPGDKIHGRWNMCIEGTLEMQRKIIYGLASESPGDNFVIKGENGKFKCALHNPAILLDPAKVKTLVHGLGPMPHQRVFTFEFWLETNKDIAVPDARLAFEVDGVPQFDKTGLWVFRYGTDIKHWKIGQQAQATVNQQTAVFDENRWFDDVVLEKY